MSLGSLTTLPAFRAYLDGVARYRHGHYDEAARALDRALDLDSTFIYAALALLPAQLRIGGASALHHDPAAIVWRNRDRFSPADRAIALAYLGPGYPAVSSQVASIAAWRKAVAAAPENADAWFALGDMLLHYGALNDVPRPVEEARLAFGRATALDSEFIFPIDHALLAAFELRDTAAIRTLLPLLLTRDSTSDIAVFSRWRAAIALGDSATLVRIRAALPGASDFSLRWMYNLAQHQAVGLADGYRALELLRARATAPQQIQRLRDDARTFLLNLGRPRESVAQLALDDTAGAAGRWRVVVEQLWDDGDSALAVSAAASLGRALHAPATAPADRGFAACALGFRLARRRASDSLPALTRELRALPLPADAPPFVHDDAVYCAAVLDAWYAALLHEAAAGALLARTDSIVIASTTSLFLPGFLAEAEIANLEGDARFALRVLRRRPVALPGFTELRAGFFLGRARAAAAVGETAEAREAYGDYLRLRAGAEPSLRPVTDSVRAELARLGP